MKDTIESINYINNKISEWYSLIKSNNCMSFYNINSFSENFVRDILNNLFQLELINSNLLKKNAKAIDLESKDLKHAFQVTTENTMAKIRHTVEEYVDNEYNQKYENLKIIILDYKSRTKRPDIEYNGFTFEMKNVYYFDDLLNIIKNSSPLQVLELRKYFELEYDKYKKIKQMTKLKEQLKKQKLIDFPVIERTIIKPSDKNSYYWDAQKNIDIESLLNASNKIAILGEAASGKSTYLKYMVDYINENMVPFSFYYKLSLYTGEEIEKMMPSNFESLDKNSIVFILDGLDEMEEKYVSDFIKRITKFCDENKSCKIVISCRTNFYNKSINEQEYNIVGFEEYLLMDLRELDVKKYLKNKGIDSNKFLKIVEDNSYRSLISSPFYLNILSTIFSVEKNLPPQNMLFKNIINKYYEQDMKKNLLNKRDFNELQEDVQKVGFVFECLGRNYLSDAEIKSFVTKKVYKNLKHCCLLECVNDKWSFIHNNFGEYLASLELNKYSKSEVYKLIFEKKSNKIKKTWSNTIAFFLMNGQDKEIIEKILENNPELIFNIESDKISNHNKLLFFTRITDYYMNKNIWIPSNYLYNNRFVEFFSTKEIYEYLCNVIVENNHYVKVQNALSIMQEMVFYYKDNQIFDIANQILYSSKYSKYDRKSALYILANGDYGDTKYIKKLIEDLKQGEEQYLRAGYFYYINQMNIVDEMVNDIINYKSVVGKLCMARWSDDYEDDDSTTLYDEHAEFVRMFQNLKSKQSIDLIIDFLSKDEDRKNRLDEESIKNMCYAIDNLDESEEIKKILLFKLCLSLMDSYTNGRKILEIIEKRKLRISLFEYYVNNCNKKVNYILMLMINKDCAMHIYLNYKEKKYSSEILRLAIPMFDYDSVEYNELKNAYESQTNEIFPKPIIPLSEEEKQKINQKCFDSIFDKSDFKALIIYFFDIIKLDEIKLDEIFKIDYEQTFWDDVIFQYIRSTLYQAYSDKNQIIKKNDLDNLLSKWDWDWLIIDETIDFLKHHSYIIINNGQRLIIESICKKWINQVDFSNAITYQSATSCKINMMCLNLSYLRRKLSLKFPDKVLLDMLEFEIIDDGKYVEIDELVSEIGYERSKNRILYNLTNKKLYGNVLDNHIDFCIKHNLYENNQKIYEYLFSDMISDFGKIKCVEYLIKSGNKKYIKMIFDNFNTFSNDLTFQIISYLNNNTDKFIIKNICHIFDNIKFEKSKMELCSILISNNKLKGIKYYYHWINNNKSYSRNINNSLSKINKVRYLPYCFKLLQLTFNDNYKEIKFDSMQSNIKNSIINIAKKNMFVQKIIILNLKKLIKKNKDNKYIGFLNYDIQTIISEKELFTATNFTIKDIKKMLK